MFFRPASTYLFQKMMMLRAKRRSPLFRHLPSFSPWSLTDPLCLEAEMSLPFFPRVLSPGHRRNLPNNPALAGLDGSLEHNWPIQDQPPKAGSKPSPPPRKKGLDPFKKNTQVSEIQRNLFFPPPTDIQGPVGTFAPPSHPKARLSRKLSPPPPPPSLEHQQSFVIGSGRETAPQWSTPF